MPDEMQIIERVLCGDSAEFRWIVERYQQPVMSIVRHLAGESTDCEDIAQEVFLSAFRHLKSFDVQRSRFSTWLFTIARNKSMNALRDRRTISLRNRPARSHSDEPTELLERAEVFRELDNALIRLPDRYRRAFVLSEFEGLPYDQIAQIEGIGLGTVKSRIHRAKAMLQCALARFRNEKP